MNEKRVAIVTGGSRGIGAAIVRQLAKDDVHVIAIARNLDKLKTGSLTYSEMMRMEGFGG